MIWTDDNTHEYIEEAGAMNIFIRIDDTLITGPTSDRILDVLQEKVLLILLMQKIFLLKLENLLLQRLLRLQKVEGLKKCLEQVRSSHLSYFIIWF